MGVRGDFRIGLVIVLAAVTFGSGLIGHALKPDAKNHRVSVPCRPDAPRPDSGNAAVSRSTRRSRRMAGNGQRPGRCKHRLRVR